MNKCFNVIISSSLLVLCAFGADIRLVSFRATSFLLFLRIFFFLNVCSFALFFLLHKRARVNAQNLLARVRREEEEEIRDVQRVFVVLFVGRSNASCRDVSVFLL
jgi:uncharacterized SAM-binding protein YcdF (DUF218 family)